MNQAIPGPWKWHRVDRTTWSIYSEDYGGIVTLHQYPDSDVMPDSQCDATAALISAAPDMLAALEECFLIPAMQSQEDPDDAPAIYARWEKSARAAIAKAKGEQP